MAFYSATISKLQQFLVKARVVKKYADDATKYYNELKASATKVLDAIKQKISIQTLCLNSQLSEKGACFSVDAKVTFMGKPKEINNEEACMTKEGMKDLAKRILRRLFPDFDSIKEKAMSIKGFVSDAKKQDVEKAQKDFEKAEKDGYKKRDLEDDGIDYDAEFQRLVDPEPEFVTRNDDTILPFNRLFYRQDSDIISSDDADSTSGDTQAAGIRIDTAALSDKTDMCRRSQAAIQVYGDSSSILNAILQNNKEAKEGYENFTSSWAKRFDSMEQEQRALGAANNMTADQMSQMMFYVQYGRDGVANMKRQFDTQFDILDKKSMKQFKAAFGQTVAQQNLNVAGFIELMESTGQEVAKKWVVPGKENNMENNINYAEQVIKSILTSDEGGVTARSDNIEKLANSVTNMKSLAENCK